MNSDALVTGAAFAAARFGAFAAGFAAARWGAFVLFNAAVLVFLGLSFALFFAVFFTVFFVLIV